MKNINWKTDLEKQQINLLIRIIALFWFTTKIWSYKTWITDRFYPVIPPWDFLKSVPSSLHIILYALSLSLLLIIWLINRSRLLLIFFLVIEIMSCLLDSVRWQPWEYMYLCIFVIFSINFQKPKNVILLIHLLLFSMYLFSGLHKLNRDFLERIWMNLILVKYFGLPIDFILKYKLFFLGLIIPIFQISFAALLVFSKNKKLISLLLIGMHLGILIVLVCLKHNSIVWFWNLALIFILLILYNRPLEFDDFKSFTLRNIYWLILWFVMPIFSFSGMWYQYLSFNLYSGKGKQMYIYSSPKQKISGGCGIINDGKLQYISLQSWAMEEIKSASVPEMEIYKKISDKIKRKYGKKNVKVILQNPISNKTVEL